MTSRLDSSYGKKRTTCLIGLACALLSAPEAMLIAGAQSIQVRSVDQHREVVFPESWSAVPTSPTFAGESISTSTDIPQPSPIAVNSAQDRVLLSPQNWYLAPKSTRPPSWSTPFLSSESASQATSTNRSPFALASTSMSTMPEFEQVVENSKPAAIESTDPGGLLLDQPWTYITPYEKEQLDRLTQRGLPQMNCGASLVGFQSGDFGPTPVPVYSWCPPRELETYYGKTFVPTQRPWVEFWRPFYSGGMYSPAIPVFSDVNPLSPQLIVFGDYRTGIGVHRNAGANNRNWAHRLNLEGDLRLTATERIHAFMGPLDHGGRFTRLDFSNGDVEFEEELDAQLNTVFFEGDLGAITGGFAGVDAPFDLPFTFGLVPLLYQNGIWMEDAIAGAALGFPWKHSLPLNWSNFDATFFAGFHDVTSPAFGNDNSAASVFGTAWFIEAYDGYIEADYAYLDDQESQNRDYHNFALAYSRRYWSRISNSVRCIVNLGQEGSRVNRTADGGILLFENSLISPMPSTVIPYSNFFFGYGSPQSVARANGSGGILRNTGINFESDGLTGYPTLDATGSNAYGGAVGINFLNATFTQQFAVEFAAIDTYGDDQLSTAPGPQYAIGGRWQRALNNWSLVRVDLMNGWLDNAPDIYGTRIEYRWKF